MATASLPNRMYTVGWICALAVERAVAKAMLDETHQEPQELHPNDKNLYTLGKINRHNVVIACLPAGDYGIAPAATVAEQMLSSFGSIKFVLLVGVGGGIPCEGKDIRLGDVVVSEPDGVVGGVVQYDRGKAVGDGQFERRGWLDAPPRVLLNGLNGLKGNHMLGENRIPEFLKAVADEYPTTQQHFSHPGTKHDLLYEAAEAIRDESCDMRRLVERPDRRSLDPVVHYGAIASGNQVIKDAFTRDRLRRELGNVLCFEMEAAGLMNTFPCLVIRGICDYADYHKNDLWQGYAAATAAACAKELLYVIHARDVENTSRAAEVLITEDESKCLKSLETSDYNWYKRYVVPHPAEGTCTWVLRHIKYREWRDEMQSSLLWISGDPGCGKSVLSSFLIDELKRGAGSESTVCFFFFKDDESTQKSANYAICALLHQLFGAKISLLKHALAESRDCQRKFTNDFHTLWKIFTNATSDSHCGNVFCVVDGLDECSDRVQFIKSLIRFYETCRTYTTRNFLKFIITGRPYREITNLFKALPEVRLEMECETRAIRNDIELFIKAVVKGLVASWTVSADEREREQRKLEDSLVKYADHTFLWIHLILDMLKYAKEDSEMEFNRIIKNPPSKLDAIYEKILGKCPDLSSARKILHIIIAAARPLTFEEMNIALQIQPGQRSTAGLNRSFSESGLKELCGLFIRVIDHKFYLVHHTAKEFLLSSDNMQLLGYIQDTRFEGLCRFLLSFVYHFCILLHIISPWKHMFDPVLSNHIMAEICISFLLLSVFEESPLVIHPRAKGYNVREEVDQYTKDHGFLNYASKHWAYHFRMAKVRNCTALLKSTRKVCDTRSKRFRTWFQVYWITVDPMWPCPEGFTDLMLSSYFGHDMVVLLLLKEGVDVNTKDSVGKTALHYAADMGHELVVQLLLEKSADTAAKDEGGRMALHNAAEKGHKKVAQLLLEKMSDGNARVDQGYTALHLASMNGHEEVTRLLQQKGADASVKTILGYTALHLAAMNGYEAVACSLLKEGADIAAQDKNGGTALHKAAENGHGAVVCSLLKGGANIAAQDKNRGTALHKAAENGNGAVVCSLLKGGANIAAQDGDRGTALHKAAENGHEAIVRLLIERGVDINAKDGNGKTALHHTAEKGHTTLSRLLAEEGVDVNEKDYNQKTPLHYAAEKGCETIVRLLFEKGAHIMIDGEGLTPLHWAALKGHRAVAQLLIGSGANVNVRTKNEWMALHRAAERGHEAVAGLLIEKGADIIATDRDNQTALHLAAKRGHEAVVRLLIEKGADVTATNRDNWTALHLAAEQGHEAVTRRLVEAKADVNAKGGREETALHLAATGGHEAVARLLIVEGRADVSMTDYAGGTALHLAAWRGHAAVARTLLVDGKADVNASGWGETALHLAAWGESEAVVKLLVVEGNADVNAKDGLGRTALHTAAARGNTAVAMLLQGKADVSITDNDGRTALCLAEERGHREVVELLSSS